MERQPTFYPIVNWTISASAVDLFTGYTAGETCTSQFNYRLTRHSKAMCNFILYSVAPLLVRMASSSYFNVALFTSDFYGFLAEHTSHWTDENSLWQRSLSLRTLFFSSTRGIIDLCAALLTLFPSLWCCHRHPWIYFCHATHKPPDWVSFIITHNVNVPKNKASGAT